MKLKQTGLTLIELLVTLGIVAVLTSVAAPSITTLIQKSAMSSAVNTFLADMRFARTESMRLGGSVIMCRSNSPEATNPTCGTGTGPNGNGWVSGWIIFHDLGGDGDKSTTDPLLRVQSPITNVNSIMEMGLSTSSTKFEFSPTGRLSLGASRGFQFGSATQFATSAQRVVCVNLGGRARIAGDGSKSCGTDQ